MTGNRHPKTKPQKVHWNYMFDRMNQLEWDLHFPTARNWAIPAKWHDIAARTKRGEKVKITMWVEKDIVRFFKSLGHPYQPKMNEVLGAFMEAKIAGVLHEAGEVDQYFEEVRRKQRPKLGDADAEWEAVRREIDEMDAQDEKK